MPCQAARNSTLMPAAKSFNLKVTGIMKKLFYSLAVLAAVTACNKEIEQQPAPVVGEGVDFIATFEDADTRVYLGEDYFYRWEAGDPVSVFTGSNHDQYKAAAGDVVETTLEYVSTTATLGSTLSENYAVYPYNAANTIENGVVSTTLPAEQTYNPAVPTGINNAIMVSKASGTEFVFKNSCALVKVNLKIAEDFVGLHSVKSIRVSSKKHPLSGAATINVAGGDYTAKVAAESKDYAVRLVDCEGAGMLQAESVLTFFVAIPAGTYEANDLTVSVLTSTTSIPFSQSFTLKNSHTVNRSQYLEVTATIADGYDWFDQNDDDVIIKNNVVLVDKAIMTYDENFILQGFDGQDRIETIFDVPDHDMVITGWDLVNGGYATSAANGPVIVFKKAEADYIMNSLTTTNSGVKNLTPNKITLRALTITGELRTTTMGIWVHNDYTKPTLPPGYTSHDQTAFNTEFDNVNVVDCVIPLYTVKYGAALCINGKALLTNCVVKGTTPASEVPVESYGDIYDMAITNNTNTTISGGEIGRILTWEHLVLTINEKAYVDYINCGTNAVSAKTMITVDDAEIGEIDCTRPTTGNPPKLGTRITLTSTAKVGTLRLSKQVASPSKLYEFIVADGAVVEKVVFDGVEMSWADFKTQYPDYIK